MFEGKKHTHRGQLFKAGLALTLGQNLTHCYSLCVSMHPFLLKLEKRKLRSIQAKFMKKYFRVYKSAFEKFALNYELTKVNYDQVHNIHRRGSRIKGSGSQNLTKRLIFM